MKKKLFLVTGFLGCCLFVFLKCGGSQLCLPVMTPGLVMDTTNLPVMNKKIIQYAEKHGKSISPTYQQAVCTEYLILILKNFCQLTREDRRRIRIITESPVDSLLKAGSSVPKGVCYALTSAGKGKEIIDLKEVRAGDFVQFWVPFPGFTWGHCGIVRAVDKERGLISMYSSSPETNGHGSQTYRIPPYIWFVRLVSSIETASN